MFAYLAFTSPWILGFLAVLPVLWLLLRLTPPSPRKVIFPALRLLQGLVTPEETPARTPWWLLLLRLIILTALIVAFAQPLLNPSQVSAGQGPLLVAIDNDWASARDWETRQTMLHDLIRQAERDDRAVMLLPTAPSANGETINVIGPLAAKAADAEIQRLAPQPWAADWKQATNALQNIPHSTDAVWLTSGLGNSDAKDFYDRLQTMGVRALSTGAPIYTLLPPQADGDDLTLAVLRTTTDDAASVGVDAVAKDGNILARLPATFTAGAPRAMVPLQIPLEIRNQVARFEIEGQRSAASTVLLDTGWEHRAVGLVGDKSELDKHSLLSSLFYIDRALKPFADIHVDGLDALLKQDMTVLILTDTTILNDDEIQPLTDWIKHGGVLVRFAGEHLGTSLNPREGDLLPVILRGGDRSLGGALSWATPQKLHAFPTGSPFQNLDIPEDVTVTRQILAEPSAELAQKTWAELDDGTPLVTAKNMGAGISILFHVPASSNWSTLPLSGLFVEMLHRIVDLSHGWNATEAKSFTTLPPLRMLDGFGEEHEPGSASMPIASDEIGRISVSPQHPPGLYGTDTYSRAFNMGPAIGQPEALTNIPVENIKNDSGEIDLQPYLLAFAFLLLLGDLLISLRLRGLLVVKRPAFLTVLTLCACLAFHPAQAATDDKTAIELTGKTYLAYVHTGDRDTDHISEAGLTSLARVLQRRTSIDHVGVAEADPNTDDLAFYPLLYWPLVPGEAPLSQAGAAHVNDYLHHGGMILFDTMNGEEASPILLTRILAGISLPPLARLPDNHVLKHSFYLLDDFPGRYANNEFWLEPEDASSYDGVATVLYGNNGWAAAWATGNDGKPLYPCSPGGELQRDHAYRFGVNLVMYALTGNYKSDQTHMQALLEKMGK